MSAYVIEVRIDDAVQVVREPMDAIERICVALAAEPRDGEPLLHAARRSLIDAGRRASLVFHAMDADLDRSTAFLDMDVVHDPDPFERLRRHLPKHGKGLSGLASLANMLTGIGNDIDFFERNDIDPVRRFRMLATMFGLERVPELRECIARVLEARTCDDLITAFKRFDRPRPIEGAPPEVST